MTAPQLTLLTGVLLYEMLTGLPPYYDENVNTMCACFCWSEAMN